MTEKQVDTYLKQEVKKLGGWCLKMPCEHVSGLPDRLCLLPDSIMFFAELKATGETSRKLQVVMQNKLKKLGFDVYELDSKEAINETLKKYAN